MTLRLKVASAAALLMSVVAAISATDPTFAAGASAAIDLTGSVAAISPQVTSPENTAIAAPTAGSIAASPTRSATVIFAPSRPMVQTLTVKTQDSDTLAELVATQEMPGALDDETRCLAGAVFFESKSEPLEGQLAVARVVINRRDSGRFAGSLCGVVYQPSQFSFVHGRSMPRINTDSQDWREAVAVARIAMADSWDSSAEGALYFHARRVSPGWGGTRMASIGNHIFYR